MNCWNSLKLIVPCFVILDESGLGNQKQIYEMAYAEIKACELSQVLRVVSQCVISSQALFYKEGSTGMYPKVFVGLVRGSYINYRM